MRISKKDFKLRKGHLSGLLMQFLYCVMHLMYSRNLSCTCLGGRFSAIQTAPGAVYGLCVRRETWSADTVHRIVCSIWLASIPHRYPLMP